MHFTSPTEQKPPKSDDLGNEGDTACGDDVEFGWCGAGAPVRVPIPLNLTSPSKRVPHPSAIFAERWETRLSTSLRRGVSLDPCRLSHNRTEFTV
jgi:hypothetical protein